MQFDFAALMGYTGAVFERFFGGPLGTIVSLTVLLTWAATPFYLGMRLFTRKDF
jgi:Cu-processing system permease protein